MKNFRKNIQNVFLLLAIGFFLFQTSASAFDGAILRGIKVDLLNNHNYRITIKTDKDVPIKKYVTASNQVRIDLKNVRPATFINTVYNEATDIDHVIVQPTSGNNIRIYLKGLNVASSKVILDTRDDTLEFIRKERPAVNNKRFFTEEPISQPIINSPKENSNAPIFIDLSSKQTVQKPVSAKNNTIDKIKSVTPVVSYQGRSSNNYNTPGNNMHSETFIDKFLAASIFDWVLRFLMIGVIITAVIKLTGKPKNVEINLTSQNMKSREMNMYKTAEAQKERMTKSLGLPGNKKTMPKRTNNASVSQYGLNEYKNSQLPPRRTSSASLPERNGNIRKKLNSTGKTKGAKTAAGVKPQTKPNRVSSAEKVSQKQTEEAKNNFDGVKFLETMASIYQKNGREDLASGIRDNLIRKQKSA